LVPDGTRNNADRGIGETKPEQSGTHKVDGAATVDIEKVHADIVL
jgi:hypothetical protein